VPEHALETGVEIPALVKRLEHMDQLPLVEAVEPGGHGIEFVDHVLFVVRRQRAAGDADRLRPFGKTLIRTGEPSGEGNDTLDASNTDGTFNHIPLRHYANIENVNIENRDGLDAAMNFVIGVNDRTHLARIMRRIRAINEVSRIARTGH